MTKDTRPATVEIFDHTGTRRALLKDGVVTIYPGDGSVEVFGPPIPMPGGAVPGDTQEQN